MTAVYNLLSYLAFAAICIGVAMVIDWLIKKHRGGRK